MCPRRNKSLLNRPITASAVALGGHANNAMSRVGSERPFQLCRNMVPPLADEPDAPDYEPQPVASVGIAR